MYSENRKLGPKLRQLQDDWRSRNRDWVNERERLRRQKDPSKRRASLKKWSLKNGPYLRERDRRRYADKLNATPSWADIEAMRAFYKKAKELTEKTGVPHEVDHIYPLKSPIMCGLHVPCNLQILTKAENSAKKNRTKEDALWL